MSEREKKEMYRRLMQGNMQEDIIVIEDYQRMPFMGEEYLTQYLYIGLCLSGYSKGQYDYKDYYFKAGDICWLLPDHVLRHDEASDDYGVLSVFINKSYFMKLNSQGRLPRHYYPFYVNTVSLNPEQLDLMLNSFRLLGKLAVYNHSQRDELICRMCDVIALVGDEAIMQRSLTVKNTQKTHLQIFERFYSDLTKCYCQNREVAFYAQQLSLSPKYFATVIKQITGQNASKWINHYVIVQAKWKLQHEHSKTVQQIAYQLGFSEQASFSRFFRDNTGMTPTAYRAMG